MRDDAEKIRADTRERLSEGARAVAIAANILRPFAQTFRAPNAVFTALPQIERNATAALLGPSFQAAADFLRTVDNQTERARAALDEVNRK